MRIIAGTWRGRSLIAPAGQGTRPTSDRVRQALFDMLMHAPWAGRAVLEGATVLDVFAGTGALGLEALSRGAAHACFIESDAAAIRALRANIAACKAENRTEILAVDALVAPRTHATESRAAVGPALAAHATEVLCASDASLVFLDPPYGQDLVPRALVRLKEIGRLPQGALIVAEIGWDESWAPDQPLLAERHHGAARLLIFRVA